MYLSFQAEQLKANESEISHSQDQLERLNEAQSKLRADKELLERSVAEAIERAKSLEEASQSLESRLAEATTNNKEVTRRLEVIQSENIEKEQMIGRLEKRVAELEPLNELVEHEKMRRIKVYYAYCLY